MATRKDSTNSRATKKASTPASLSLAADSRVANVHEQQHLASLRRLHPDHVVRIMMLTQELLRRPTCCAAPVDIPKQCSGLRLAAVDGVTL
jgi:hypothetical protein